LLIEYLDGNGDEYISIYRNNMYDDELWYGLLFNNILDDELWYGLLFNIYGNNIYYDELLDNIDGDVIILNDDNGFYGDVILLLIVNDYNEFNWFYNI